MIAKNPITKQSILFSNIVLLRSNEMMYLRLYALGENDKDIARFIGINKRSLNNVKRQIEKKFKSSNWLQIIAMALDMDLLKLLDFASEQCKKDALIYTNAILQLSKEKALIPSNILKDKLNTFCNANRENKTLKYQSEGDRLDLSALTYLNLKYNDLLTKDGTDGTDESLQDQHRETEARIFIQLGVKNWMGALRKAVVLDLIDAIDANKSYQYNKLQTKRTASYLNRLLYHNDISLIEKKQIIYEKLIRLNLDTELYRLFSGL